MIIKKIASIISFCLATLVAFFPFNFIIGSKAALFSCATMAIPALGYQYSLLYVILYIFTKSLFSFSMPFLFFLHRLPLFFASIALRSWNAKIFVGIPMIAMILFCMHTVGSQVFYYSWYWFIPIFIYFFAKDTLYSRALAASFIAHAIGSLVWLYFGNIPAEVWTALMPLVIVERLIIAAGMVGFIYVFKFIDSFCEVKVTV
ncbi:MAG: hypothetical protein JO129_01060 [Candidatus Dependentiae bacterium]|nr:hypothetical protein [Candidatus Dependentiae bacterium]